MIVENDCLILHIFHMDDGETREEVPIRCFTDARRATAAGEGLGSAGR